MKKLTTTILALFFSTSALAHDAKPFLEKHLQDLDKNIDLSSYFVERPQFIFGHHIHIPDTTSDASDYVRDLQKRLTEQGYAKTEIEGSKVLAEIEDYTLITFSLKRLKADGKLLDRVCSTYGVVHLKFGYKILSWQPSEINKSGKCWQ
jgi:hypothetical protein